jgi:hypothetical protein
VSVSPWPFISFTVDDNIFFITPIKTETAAFYFNSLFCYYCYSQALIVQDEPLASLSGFLDHTHIQTHDRTPLDE